jgi:hypothetical protein
VSEEHKKVKMSVSSKTLDPSSITQVKMSKHVLLTPGLSLEHDAFHFGSSCESPGPLNTPLSDFLTVTAFTQARARDWHGQRRN